MLKMYNAEVLSKFPVVQHFPFGSLFAWERDPAAKEIQTSVHTSSQPKSNPPANAQAPLRNPMADPSMATVGGGPRPMSGTAAPWATSRAPVPLPSGHNQPTKAPWLSRTPLPPPTAGGNTAAPWAKARSLAAPLTGGSTIPNMRAPGADKQASNEDRESDLQR